MNDQLSVVKIDCYILSVILTSFDGVRVVNGGSHIGTNTNMIVFGKHCYVLANLGLTAEVHVFSDKVGSLHCVPINFRFFHTV